MITWIFFLVAVLCMVLGHIYKIRRWGLFISVYEKPYKAELLQAITLGHILNTILPFRIGDIIRIAWVGRKLKNGYSFSLAIFITDLYIDVITVGMMFFGLSFIGKGGTRLMEIARIYMWAFLIIAPFTVLCVLFRKEIKKVIRVIAGIFNEQIEFRILYVSYLCIASLKDIITNISKKSFIMYSIGIWFNYVLSYVIFAEAIQRYGYHYTTSDVFTVLFSGSSLYNIEIELVPFWGAYLLLPLIICWIISIIASKSVDQYRETVFRYTLPQINQQDRLAFLKTYYEDEKRNHIQAYLDINKDVTVIEDNSAGSNASTVLVMKQNGNLFYRKYAFDEDGEKLQEQIEWIENHQKDIPLPIIVEKRNAQNYVAYDMPCYRNAVGLFRYIHTMPMDAGWDMLERALDEIRTGLHVNNRRKADLSSVEHYIHDKVRKNLRIIREEDRYIKALEQYDVIIVNGQEYHTLRFYDEIFDNMQEIFLNDPYSDVHGDLTVENIICLPGIGGADTDEYINEAKSKYYYIDPNGGNIHDSPFIDYGKMLQSLHGNYEFLMMVTSVEIDKGRVGFFMTKSDTYTFLYKQYKKYLQKHFTKAQILSIYYHEVVHWLRLMPYKIRKNEKTAVVFYTELLVVLNDIWEKEYEQQE